MLKVVCSDPVTPVAPAGSQRPTRTSVPLHGLNARASASNALQPRKGGMSKTRPVQRLTLRNHVDGPYAVLAVALTALQRLRTKYPSELGNHPLVGTRLTRCHPTATGEPSVLVAAWPALESFETAPDRAAKSIDAGVVFLA
jgi:hypothetical protein